MEEQPAVEPDSYVITTCEGTTARRTLSDLKLRPNPTSREATDLRKEFEGVGELPTLPNIDNLAQRDSAQNDQVNTSAQELEEFLNSIPEWAQEEFRPQSGEVISDARAEQPDDPKPGKNTMNKRSTTKKAAVPEQSLRRSSRPNKGVATKKLDL